MARKKRALFMTVGTGFKDNQKSLAHGLMCSIVSKDPDLICFFGSRKSKSTIDTLKQIFNESNDEDFDDYFETKFIENDNIDEFKDYFFEFKSKILELEDDYKIIIDYTSGTKTMTMSAAFASMIFGKELLENTVQREFPPHAPGRERRFPAQCNNERPRTGAGNVCNAHFRPRCGYFIFNTRNSGHSRRYGNAWCYNHECRQLY